jgi:phytoene dehydrogenase-like protein
VAQAFRPPATQRLYDVCVIGSQLGGAVAGALLARRGFRVLYVDHDGAGTHYEDGGYLLPHAPALIPSPRLMPAAEAALNELGFTTDAGRALEPSSPGLQLLFPRHRVDLHADPAARLAELRREWPSDADALDAALSALGAAFDAVSPVLKALPPLPPDGFLERRELSKAVKFAQSSPSTAVDLNADALQPMAGHPLGEALGAARSFMTHLGGPPAPFSTLRLAGAVVRGTQRIAGGYDALRDILRRRIAEARGELLGAEASTPATAERLDVDGSRVTAVRLEGSSNAYLARAFVLATSPAAVMRLVPEDLHRKIRDMAGLRVTRQLLAVNLVVRVGALPPGLGDTAIVLGEGEDAAPVMMQVMPARRDTKKGGAESVSDERVICAATYVPESTWEDGGATATQAAAWIRDRLAAFLPFLDRHVVRESIPSLAAGPERRRNTRALHPVYVSELDAHLGVSGVPFRALKNVVMAGREVVPGLGLEGEFQAGVQAADAAQAILGKKEFLK